MWSHHLFFFCSTVCNVALPYIWNVKFRFFLQRNTCHVIFVCFTISLKKSGFWSKSPFSRLGESRTMCNSPSSWQRPSSTSTCSSVTSTSSVQTSGSLTLRWRWKCQGQLNDLSLSAPSLITTYFRRTPYLFEEWTPCIAPIQNFEEWKPCRLDF